MNFFEEPPQNENSEIPCVCPHCRQGLLNLNNFKEAGAAPFAVLECTKCNAKGGVIFKDDEDDEHDLPDESMLHPTLLRRLKETDIYGEIPPCDEDLQICPDCGKDFVYPADWEPASPTHWMMSLRCPCCEWPDIGVWDNDTADRFDEKLQDGTEELMRERKLKAKELNKAEELRIDKLLRRASANMVKAFMNNGAFTAEDIHNWRYDTSDFSVPETWRLSND